MKKSGFELYSRGQIGKLKIEWQGVETNETPLTQRIIESIVEIKKLVIVIDSNPNAIQSCLRMLYSLSKKLETLSIENSVVFEMEQASGAAEMTGFDNFFSVFPNEEQAALAIGITNLYPLLLINHYAGTPDPIVA